jgi:hypothetical protein
MVTSSSNFGACTADEQTTMKCSCGSTMAQLGKRLTCEHCDEPCEVRGCLDCTAYINGQNRKNGH